MWTKMFWNLWGLGSDSLGSAMLDLFCHYQAKNMFNFKMVSVRFRKRLCAIPRGVMYLIINWDLLYVKNMLKPVESWKRPCAIPGGGPISLIGICWSDKNVLKPVGFRKWLAIWKQIMVLISGWQIEFHYFFLTKIV